jgi:hypothetical protein
MIESPAERAGQTGDRKPDLDGTASAHHTVLIAEDDPIFRHLLESWFKRWDYRVTALDNGLDA